MQESQKKNPSHSQIPPLEVVGAVFFRAGAEVLAFRRKAQQRGAGHWEFPGGKIEPGESPSAALEREIFEELGVSGRCLQALGSMIHDYPQRSIRLSLFLFQPAAWNFRLSDHDLLVWVGTAQRASLDWAPADIPWLDKVFASVKAELQGSK